MDSTNKPRIVIYTNADVYIVRPLLEKGMNIVGIAEDRDTFNNQSRLVQLVTRLKYFLLHRGQPLSNSWLAKTNKIDYLEAGSANSVALKSWLGQISPDIMLIYMTQILDKETFSIPKNGTVNLHPSLLPHYRGAHPICSMHYNFDLNGGSTLHFIDEGIDTGEIIDQKSFAIKPGMTESEIEKIVIGKHAIDMFSQFIKNKKYLSKGETFKHNKDEDSIKPYAYRMSSDNYFKSIGFNQWTLEHTWHYLRCIDTWKLKYQTDKPVEKCFELEIGDYTHTKTDYIPGTFVREGKRLFITHKDGVIKVNRKFSLKKSAKSLIFASQLALGAKISTVTYMNLYPACNSTACYINCTLHLCH